MRVHDYPEFSRVDSGLTVTGCAKLSIDYDVELGKHIESLKGPANNIIMLCYQVVDNKLSFTQFKIRWIEL